MIGPCAKLRISCTIDTMGGKSYHGTNFCNNAQVTCPRTPGEGYEKCVTICQTAGHAEVVALERLLADEGPAAATGATATVYGHYHCCVDCAQKLARAGVRKIVINVNPEALPKTIAT